MLLVMTDEQSIDYAEKQIKKVADAFVAIGLTFPNVPIEAMSQVLFMVNGPNWMDASDMARARVRAKQIKTAP